MHIDISLYTSCFLLCIDSIINHNARLLSWRPKASRRRFQSVYDSWRDDVHGLLHRVYSPPVFLKANFGTDII